MGIPEAGVFQSGLRVVVQSEEVSLDAGKLLLDKRRKASPVHQDMMGMGRDFQHGAVKPREPDGVNVVGAGAASEPGSRSSPSLTLQRLLHPHWTCWDVHVGHLEWEAALDGLCGLLLTCPENDLEFSEPKVTHKLDLPHFRACNQNISS